MRKALFVGTGGAFGLVVKSNSNKERIAKAAEKQVRLEKQLLKQQAAMLNQPQAVAAVPQLAPAGARHTARDAWLDEVVRTAQPFGLCESRRNTRGQFLGVPLEGNVGLVNGPRKMMVMLFASEALARSALDALMQQRYASLENTRSEATSVGRVLVVAVGDGQKLANPWFRDALAAVQSVSQPDATDQSHDAATSTEENETRPGAVDQPRRLGELRDSGVVTEAEFAAKKEQLLMRI